MATKRPPSGASDSMGQEPMRKILRKGDDLDDDE